MKSLDVYSSLYQLYTQLGCEGFLVSMAVLFARPPGGVN